MANPFLFMEEETANVGGGFENPFLVEDDDVGEYGSENPFSASNPFAFNEANEDTQFAAATDSVSEAGANLFLVEDDAVEQEVDATMSFFGTTINEHDGLQYQKPSELNVINQHVIFDDSQTYLSEEESKIKKPPRPNPPSQVTQQLITNLTDHLDQTSTNLLGKLPVTRSPSPVSMRDLHSPSPTHDVGDLLDVSESFAMAHQKDVNNAFAAQQIAPEPEQKPMRPPPPRPLPPRPTPPKGSLKSSPVTAPTPVQTTTTISQSNSSQPQDDDLLNFFGNGQQKKPPPKPPAPKSKEDILSLFSTSAQPVQDASQDVKRQDLLSEDIDFSMQVQTSAPSQTPVAVVQPYEQEVVMEDSSAPIAIVEPMVQSMESNTISNAHSIPKTELDQPFDDNSTIVEDIGQAMSELSTENNLESDITSGGILATASEGIYNMILQEKDVVQEPMVIVQDDKEETNLLEGKALTPPEQLQKLQFLQQKPSEFQCQRPTTPDPIVAQPELAPIFGGLPMQASAAKPAPPQPPVRGSSVLTTTAVVPTIVPDIFKSDEFDDFSAKFDSKSQPKTTGNAFLDSVTEDKVSAVDAWGDSDAFGTSAPVDGGFGNEDDGFDNWNPPVVPESTPYMNRRMSAGSDEGKDFSVVIKPKGADNGYGGVAPILGPPPPQKSPYSGSIYSEGENIFNLI